MNALLYVASMPLGPHGAAAAVVGACGGQTAGLIRTHPWATPPETELLALVGAGAWDFVAVARQVWVYSAERLDLRYLRRALRREDCHLQVCQPTDVAGIMAARETLDSWFDGE